MLAGGLAPDALVRLSNVELASRVRPRPAAGFALKMCSARGVASMQPVRAWACALQRRPAPRAAMAAAAPCRPIPRAPHGRALQRYALAGASAGAARPCCPRARRRATAARAHRVRNPMTCAPRGAQELSEQRAAIEEKALKSAVLDEETAARFSTAAALATRHKAGAAGAPAGTDWRTNTLAAADEGGGADAGGRPLRERLPANLAAAPRGTAAPPPGAGLPRSASGGRPEARPAPAPAPELETNTVSSVGSPLGLAAPLADAGPGGAPAAGPGSGGGPDDGGGGGVRVTLRAGEDGSVTTEVRAAEAGGGAAADAPGSGAAAPGDAADDEDAPPPPPPPDPPREARPGSAPAGAATAVGGGDGRLAPLGGSLDWASIKVPLSPCYLAPRICRVRQNGLVVEHTCGRAVLLWPTWDACGTLQLLPALRA